MLQSSNNPQDLETFQHQPLDHTIQSIRVVQILPDLTTDGLIQCRISHTTIDADYTCLSYVWGPAEPFHHIVINDRKFIVRRNLFHFLCNVQKVAIIGDRIWIDALCIDQAKVSERNHQVQQMGLIYSHAKCVYIWLSLTPPNPAVKHTARSSRWRKLLGRDRSHYKENTVIENVCENQYWNRAWVRQEILLAQHVKVLWQKTTLDFSDLLAAVGLPIQIPGNTFGDMSSNSKLHKIAPYIRLKPQLLYKDAAKGRQHRTQTKLILLLDRLGEAHCTVFHDRIFSLLSLCDEGKNIRVDYDLSKKGLVYSVMQHCSKTLCICSIHLLANILSSSTDTPLAIDRIGPFVELEVQEEDIHESWTPDIQYRHGFYPETISNESDKDDTLSLEGDEFVDMPLRISFPGRWDSDGSYDCDIASQLVSKLRTRAVWFSSNIPPGYKRYPHSLGEPIEIPEHLQVTMNQARLALHRPPEEVCLCADGFSFVIENGRTRKVRISLDLVLNFVEHDDWRHRKPIVCYPVRILDYSATKRLGYGPWNTMASRESTLDTPSV